MALQKVKDTMRTTTALDGSKLANDSITLAHMASGTDGQVITYSAAGDPVAVGPGTTGQVLTSAGANLPQTFATPAAGGTNGWHFISSTTVSSAVANINFTGLSNTYHQYIVSIQSSNCSSWGERLNILTSSDNGSSYDNTSGDYRWHLMKSDSDAEAHKASQSVNSTKLPIGYNTGSVSHISLSGTVRIHDPANTAMWTIVDSQVTALNYDGSTVHQGSLAGVRMEAAAVDAIRFYYDSGNIATGTFRLYGLVNS